MSNSASLAIAEEGLLKSVCKIEDIAVRKVDAGVKAEGSQQLQGYEVMCPAREGQVVASFTHPLLHGD